MLSLMVVLMLFATTMPSFHNLMKLIVDSEQSTSSSILLPVRTVHPGWQKRRVQEVFRDAPILEFKIFHKFCCKISFSELVILHQFNVKRYGCFNPFNNIFA